MWQRRSPTRGLHQRLPRPCAIIDCGRAAGLRSLIEVPGCDAPSTCQRPCHRCGLISAAGVGACSQSGLPSLPSRRRRHPSSIAPTQLETGAVAAPATPAPETVTIAAGHADRDLCPRRQRRAALLVRRRRPAQGHAHLQCRGRAALRGWCRRDRAARARSDLCAISAGPAPSAWRSSAEGGSVRGRHRHRSRSRPPMAELMVQDVETWAQGGSGCQARAR